MSTTVSVTTTYAGEFAGKYVAAALLSANTIEKGYITVKPNIKYRETLKKAATSGLLKDQSCDFTATGTITLTERVLEPKALQVNVQLCKDSFRSDWEAVSMGYSAFDTLPKNFADFLVAHVAADVAASNEVSIWHGDASNSGEFDGFITLLENDTDLVPAQEVAGTTVTAANVITELGKIVDAIPARLYGKEGLAIYASSNIIRAYVRALGGFGTQGLGASGVGSQGTMWYNGQGLNFDGVPLLQINGLNDDTAICTTKENLYFGTGLLSDMNQVKVLDMADLDGSENVRVIMRMTAGVNYANVEDIVTYGVTNSVNPVS